MTTSSSGPTTAFPGFGQAPTRTADIRADDAAHLTGHEYDGISEFDNPTPGWWHIIFLVSIGFSAVYFLFWSTSDLAWTTEDAWKQAQTAEYRRIFADVGELAPDEPTILRMMGDPKFLAIAEASFQSSCANCHARDGGGIVGPNLCDDHYKNVKSVKDIFTVITSGANNGAMPAWGPTISQNERVILAAYVASLRGKTPASAKPPEGDAIPPFPAPTPPTPPKP
ncbi:MAG: c-type cytochrome [Phycisphaerae bacterium]|nr:c-type cytochrome [Phycisphaerae bacterium]